MHDESRQPDKNAQEPDWDALARHVAGESDPAEVRTLDAWLASHPADAALVRTVKAHSDIAEASAATSVDVEAALQSVRARLAKAGGVSAEGSGDQSAGFSVVRGGMPLTPARTVRGNAAPKPGIRFGRLAFAAAATVVAILGLRQWQGNREPAGVERVLATAVGVRDSIRLSDGTRVVLAPGSRLTVAASFDRGDRVVLLEGAAYFDVRHDEAHPFTVRAANAEIRDVGTVFTVKTDAIGGVSVAVTHGIVAIREATASAPSAVELRAGDRGIVSAGTVVVSRGTVTEEEMGWTSGQLTYRDAPLTEVQADLKRWYGINLVVADSALSRLTVTMPVQQDSARVVSTIAALLGADAELRGDTVILRSAGRDTKP